MAKILSNAVTWIIVLLCAILTLLAGVVFGWWGDGESGPEPETTSSPTPTASVALPGFVERPVTESPYLPSAEMLTEGVLESVGSGWVVAINDSTRVDTAASPPTSTIGPKILYLISPDGTRYELANLDSLGLDSPNLVAWNGERDSLLLVEDRSEIEVLTMSSGELAFSWAFCGEGGDIRYGEARRDDWLIRGGCQGEGIDGIYTDEGVFVPSTIVGAGPYLTVMDVGPIQVQYEFEGSVDQKFIAYSPDGFSTLLPWSDAGDCYPLGKGQGATLAMYCYSDGGDLSIWELPVDGTPPIEVVTATQLEEFAQANGGYGPGDFWVTDYCSDSALSIAQVSLGDEGRLGVLYGGSLEAVGESSYPFRVCHAVEGTSALVSGDGPLWWTDFDSGSTVTLLPGSGPGSSIQVVGTEGYTALRLP